MAGLNRVPAFAHVQIGSLEEVAYVAEDQVVDRRFVEHLGSQTFFVGRAERQFPIRVLRDDYVNTPAVVLGEFARDALPQLTQRRANGKRGRIAEGKASKQTRAQTPSSRLGLGFQGLAPAPAH